MHVVRSAGGMIDYLGTVGGLPMLCRERRANGVANYYLGFWREDWPGAGQAYPAMHAAMSGPKGAYAEFVTRSVPGMQWLDSFTNEGVEPSAVDGHTYQVLRLAHGRKGIEGNTYHSVITVWIDIATGMMLKAVENQISGQSYGPETTWTAIRVERLP